MVTISRGVGESLCTSDDIADIDVKGTSTCECIGIRTPSSMSVKPDNARYRVAVHDAASGDTASQRRLAQSRYSYGFRRDVAELMTSECNDPGQVAAAIGITTKTLQRWTREFGEVRWRATWQ